MSGYHNNNNDKGYHTVNLTFMGPCIVIIWYVLPTRRTSHRVFLFNLITALHVSGVTTTHPQGHKATASTASGNYYTVLLSAAIVEKLELKIGRASCRERV